MEVTWAPSGVVRELAGPPMHRHGIVGSQFAPKVGCLIITCEDLVCMAIARLVDGLQVNDNGPMDPR
jgi:hypothetical protein